MSRYYNMTRGPLVVVLRDGTTTRLVARAMLDATQDQDRSADILAKLRKRMLKKIDALPHVQFAAESEIEVHVEPVPQDLVDDVQEEVAETPLSSVELDELSSSEGGGSPEETPEEDHRPFKRRFGKQHRS